MQTRPQIFIVTIIVMKKTNVARGLCRLGLRYLFQSITLQPSVLRATISHAVKHSTPMVA
jgi:hypothetical protein